MLKYDSETHTITTDSGYLKLEAAPIPLISPYQIGSGEDPNGYIEISKSSYDYLLDLMNPKKEEPVSPKEKEGNENEKESE